MNDKARQDKQVIEVGQVWHSDITNSDMLLVAKAQEDDKVYLSGMNIFSVSYNHLLTDYTLYRNADGSLAEPEAEQDGVCDVFSQMGGRNICRTCGKKLSDHRAYKKPTPDTPSSEGLSERDTVNYLINDAIDVFDGLSDAKEALEYVRETIAVYHRNASPPPLTDRQDKIKLEWYAKDVDEKADEIDHLKAKNETLYGRLNKLWEYADYGNKLHSTRYSRICHLFDIDGKAKRITTQEVSDE